MSTIRSKTHDVSGRNLEAWRGIVDAFKRRRNSASTTNKHLDTLVALLDSALKPSQNAVAQLSAFRRVGTSIGKAAQDKEITQTDRLEVYRFLDECVLPGALDRHFTPSATTEASFRGAIFALFVRSNEYVDQTPPENLASRWDRMLARSRLQNRYGEFLKEFGSCSVASGQDPTILTGYCAVVLATHERNVAGKAISLETYEETLVVLVTHLNELIRLINTASSTSDQSFDASNDLHLNGTQSTCADLLKTITALLSRFSEAVHTTMQGGAGTRDGNETIRKLLDAAVTICFTPNFSRDAQFMAGFLIASLLYNTSPVGAVQTLFGTGLSLAIPAHAANKPVWYEDERWDYSTLCIFRGLLTTFNERDMFLTVPNSQQNALTLILEKTLRVCDSSSDAATRILAFQTLAAWLTAARSILAGKTADATQDELTQVIQLIHASTSDKIFAYVFNGWEDQCDALQHKLKDVLDALLDLLHVGSLSETAKPHIEHMLHALLNADWHRKVKYDLLSLMLSKVRPHTIIQLRSKFLDNCFEVMTNPMLASRVTAFINRFLKDAFADIPKDQRRNRQANEFWVAPVCRALTNQNQVVRKFCSENMTTLVMKENPASFPLILDTLESYRLSDTSTTKTSFSLHATIAVSKAARSLDLIKIDAFLAEKGDMVDQAISHPDPNLRIDVLALLCEARQQTADFSSEELRTLQQFLLISLDSQSPEFRQRVQTHLVKLLRRLRRAMYANWRDYLSRKAFIDHSEEVGDCPPNLSEMRTAATELLAKLDMKRDFVRWLIDTTVASLFPGCSFQRTSSNLALMSTIFDSEDTAIDVTAKVTLADMPDYPVLGTPRTVRALIGIICNDTFTPNRERAYALLVRLPSPLPGYEDAEAAGELVRTGVEWVASVKSHQSDTGAMVVKLVFEKYVKALGWRLSLTRVGEMTDTGSHDPTIFFVRQLVGLLTHNIAIAKRNLYQSATAYPMHGLFRALHNILSEIPWASPTVHSHTIEWKSLVAEIWELVSTACEAVLAICADESPEGNLPASFADMQKNMEDVIAEAEADDEEEEEGDTKKSDAQLMLYACFHTIKETSAVTQAVVCRAPLPKSMGEEDNATAVLTYDQIESAGNLLRTLLGSIRHRGAFSAVHTSFASLCATLLSSNQSQLIHLPEAWLKHFLAQVVSVDTSITRRSAGLPLGVLAVITGAPPTSRSSLLKLTFARLFAIAAQPVPADANERLDLPQVHAFNVVRAVLQDATLAPDSRPFLGQAFELCVNGFSSPCFPVRNCAAMLFSTLVNKIFGTKKTKDEQHAVNALTAREFFARYPALHPLLLRELSAAAELLETRVAVLHPALYPILMILARLKPSAVDDPDVPTTTSLTPFRPVVARCAAATIYKARVMAAHAFAPLVQSETVVGVVEGLLAPLSSPAGRIGPGQQNAVHGALLQVQAVMRLHLAQRVARAGVRREAIERLPVVFGRMRGVETGMFPLTRELFTGLLTEFFVEAVWVRGGAGGEEEEDLSRIADEAFAPLRQALLESGLPTPAHELSHVLSPLDYAIRRAQATQLLKLLTTSPRTASSTATTTATIIRLVTDADYDVQLDALGFVAEIVATNNQDIGIEVDPLVMALKGLVLSKAPGLYYRVRTESASLLVRLFSRYHAATADTESFATAVTTALLLPSSSTAPASNITSAEAYLPLLGALYAHLPTPTPTLIRILSHWTRDDQPLSVRLAAAECLRLMRLAHIVEGGKEEREERLVVDLLFLLERLLEDDDPDVREVAAEVVSGEVLGVKQTVTAARCRLLLGRYLATRSWTHASTSSYVVECFAGLLLGPSASAEGLAAFESAIIPPAQNKPTKDSTGTPSPILFAKEAANPRREPFVDAYIAFGSLTAFLARTSSPPLSHPPPASLPSYISSLQSIFHRFRQHNRKADPRLTFDHDVFAALARYVLAVRVVAAWRGEEADTREVVEMFEGGEVHPSLVAVVGDCRVTREVCTGSL
ncbi:putative death-receptor fusion protein-domain-containing protein [Fimicolochytrium jonesii]|uniref:putative death-receptor fusion protein-domain-containing protein n=1 Tax=Fimicolochytrium jonesii TaxID=1396493 RepID=UPI0022FEA44D|nr:putative death-receptor fusion protein-domain-containing protein [Fimicolochytrium jonesii]KAI8821746.1 putative death-receptor fusion protein-domain-containing protein [Fimicolochytrium jonesii]